MPDLWQNMATIRAELFGTERNGTDFAFEVAFKVGDDAVVVEQRVVHVEQKRGR